MNHIHRRTLLTVVGRAPLWTLAVGLVPRLAAQSASDRTVWWAPSTKLIAAEWRYVAGRVTDNKADYGFVVSLGDSKYPSARQELLVQRQDFNGAGAFVSTVYEGKRTYTSSTATYDFTSTDGRAQASARWDAAAQVYRLSLTSPELILQNIALIPQGALIPEGGTGDIGVGVVNGIKVGSDYHADWAQIAIDGAVVGTARVDMQTLRPATAVGLADTGAGDYDHHWFAVAGALDDGTSVWLSAWRLESQGALYWDVTVAQGSGSSWQVESFTETSAIVTPLTVQVLDFQPLPTTANLPHASTGSRWRLTAGLRVADDFTLEVAVPPGQFVSGVRVGEVAGITVMEEGVGTVASGTIFGKALHGVTLAVAESTAEYYLQQLPVVLK